jgi:hypothetical protein
MKNHAADVVGLLVHHKCSRSDFDGLAPLAFVDLHLRAPLVPSTTQNITVLDTMQVATISTMRHSIGQDLTSQKGLGTLSVLCVTQTKHLSMEGMMSRMIA